MDFSNSETRINLARAFAGEAQARTRYQIYEKQARSEGQAYIASIFGETADNELAHAKEFYKLLLAHSTEPLNNLEITAGYPYLQAATLENLKFAADGEHDENAVVYPKFAKIANEEGFEDVYLKFTQIAEIEGLHSRVYTDVYEQLKTGILYKRLEPITWRCMNCGHVHYGGAPFETCPVCSHPQGYAQGNIKMS